MFNIALKVLQKASNKARKTGVPQAVVEIDHEEGRIVRIVPESYLDDPEFEAFCGEVVYLTSEDV